MLFGQRSVFVWLNVVCHQSQRVILRAKMSIISQCDLDNSEGQSLWNRNVV